MILFSKWILRLKSKGSVSYLVRLVYLRCELSYLSCVRSRCVLKCAVCLSSSNKSAHEMRNRPKVFYVVENEVTHFSVLSQQNQITIAQCYAFKLHFWPGLCLQTCCIWLFETSILFSSLLKCYNIFRKVR